MTKKIFTLLYFFIISSLDYVLIAQHEKATAIILKENTQYNVGMLNHYKVIYSVKLKILKKEAEDDFFFGTSYDANRKILSMQAVIKDTTEKVIRTINQNAFVDKKYISSTFHDDIRYKYAEIHHTSYPYIVDFYYEVLDSGPWLNQTIYAQSSLDFFVTESQINVTALHDKHLRFQEVNQIWHKKPDFVKNGNTYLWTYKNIPPVDADRNFLPARNAYLPQIKILPNKVFDGEKSYSISSWDELGNFYANLNVNRRKLPEEATAKIAAICAGKDTDEKIKILYK